MARRLPAPKFGGIRTGGRSARVVARVFTTTLTALGEVGYGALRIDDVAARAGVNKTTIYRRWPVKSQLVAAALEHYHVIAPPHDTGDLAADLTQHFVEAVSKFDVTITRGLMRMIQLEQHDPEVDAIIDAIRESVLATRRTRLDLAVKRGELPRRTDVVLLVYMLSSSVHALVTKLEQAPSRKRIADIVIVVTAGARARWA
ncbi:MAG TPA: TetR/AcrR family transcriptional regulator [Kofleriaceae bacterium]